MRDLGEDSYNYFEKLLMGMGLAQHCALLLHRVFDPPLSIPGPLHAGLFPSTPVCSQRSGVRTVTQSRVENLHQQRLSFSFQKIISCHWLFRSILLMQMRAHARFVCPRELTPAGNMCNPKHMTSMRYSTTPGKESPSNGQTLQCSGFRV